MTREQTTSPSYRVLVTDKIAERGLDLLRSAAGFEVTVEIGADPQLLRSRLPEFDALIVRSGTKVTADLLVRPGRLKVIGRAGTGVDNIDIEAASRAGVHVINTPGANSIAAAELTLAHLFALARNVIPANEALRHGRWERKEHIGVELCGKTLGVVGLGRIGREVARAALALRMEVVGHDPCVPEPIAADIGVRWLPLEDLVARADFVTLHVPLTAETRHLFDAERLRRMKPGARLVNCARGGLVDEAALLEALESGHLAGAALDVFENEPPADPRLARHPRVVATPHLGASTREAQERVSLEIAEKVRDALRDGTIVDSMEPPRN